MGHRFDGVTRTTSLNSRR